MRSNRRPSRLARFVRAFLARLWQVRRVLLLALPYLLLFSWLFGEERSGDPRPAEIYRVPAEPLWSAPDRLHWFGTTAVGADVFALTRLALAHSVSVAVVAVSLGIALALLATSLFVFDPGQKRFLWLERVCRAAGTLPAMVGLVIFAGGAGGGAGIVLLGLSFAVALPLVPVLTAWFRDGEAGFETVSAYVVGLSRREIVLGRVLPTVLRRLPGTFAALVPVVALAEMGLSFLGLAGEKLSLGSMLAYGRDFIIEAPWLAIYPGTLATLVLAALALLGWRVSAALDSGEPPRFL